MGEKQYGNRVISFFLDVPDEIRKQRAIKRGTFDEIEWNSTTPIDEDELYRVLKEYLVVKKM